MQSHSRLCLRPCIYEFTHTHRYDSPGNPQICHSCAQMQLGTVHANCPLPTPPQPPLAWRSYQLSGVYSQLHHSVLTHRGFLLCWVKIQMARLIEHSTPTRQRPSRIHCLLATWLGSMAMPRK